MSFHDIEEDIPITDLDMIDKEPDMDEINYQFSKQIAEKHPWEFIGGVIYGPRRIGKSLYAIKTLMQFLESMGVDEERAWTLALRLTYFDPTDFVIDTVLLAMDRKKVPCMILDDAGVGFSGSQWFSNRETAVALKSVLDTLGTVTTGLILTTPQMNKIMNEFSDATDLYRVDLSKLPVGEKGPHGVRASAYGIRVLPSGDVRIKKKTRPDSGFVDELSVYIENEKFEQYRAIRGRYTAKTGIDALRNVIGEEKVEKLFEGQDFDKRGEIYSKLEEQPMSREQVEQTYEVLNDILNKNVEPQEREEWEDETDFDRDEPDKYNAKFEDEPWERFGISKEKWLEIKNETPVFAEEVAGEDSD